MCFSLNSEDNASFRNRICRIFLRHAADNRGTDTVSNAYARPAVYIELTIGMRYSLAKM